MTHLEHLEKEIAELRSQLGQAQSELTAHNAAVAEAVTRGETEKDIDKKQVWSDIDRRRIERLTLGLANLEARRPVAAAEDAKEELPVREKEIATRCQRLSDAYAKVDAAWRTFVGALEECEAEQKANSDLSDLLTNVESLRLEHDLPPPVLPGLPAFPAEPIRPTLTITSQWTTLRPRFFACAVWQPEVSGKVRKRRAAAEEKHEARRASVDRAA